FYSFLTLSVSRFISISSTPNFIQQFNSIQSKRTQM
ncbi:unnamed protein product, partial [Rotaria magnacalcarata]